MKLTNNGQLHVCGIPAPHKNETGETHICNDCLLPVDAPERKGPNAAKINPGYEKVAQRDILSPTIAEAVMMVEMQKKDILRYCTKCKINFITKASCCPQCKGPDVPYTDQVVKYGAEIMEEKREHKKDCPVYIKSIGLWDTSVPPVCNCKEEKPQSLNFKIGKYVDRNDVRGLADFFRAYLEDEIFAREDLISAIEKLRPDACSCSGAKFECEHWGRHEMVDEVLEIIKKTI